MRVKGIIACFILIGTIAVVYGLSEEPHEFSYGECSICHFDEKKEPMNIKPDITNSCETCHSAISETQSHPTDLYPTLPIPEDMPLSNGLFTCITCHYVHPGKESPFVENSYFLRRQVRGPLFCGICHEIDKNGHIVSRDVHTGSFTITNPSSRIDIISLECITCHDAYLTEPKSSLGAGNWNHTSKLNHPIGISYENISARETRNYRPATMLNKEMKLFNGKIGCGTCHNIYSKLKSMLVMDNTKSRICLECHIK